jgi:hypothetical protein
LLEAEEFDAMAKNVEGATLVELIAQAGEEGFGGGSAVIFGESFPSLRLRRLGPSEDIGRKQSARAIVLIAVTLGVEPTVSAEVLTHLGFEIDFFVEAHAAVATVFMST